MDKSIVAVEESHWRADSPASGSKLLGSLVQINSIAIDISCAMEEMQSPLHEHFSIRGFVAGMREKDLKTCLPFASQGVKEDLVDNNLPPLSAPKFRWWQCLNCVPDIASTSTAQEILLADRSDPCTNSCQNVGGEKDDMFSNGIRNIGNGRGSRKSIDGKYNDPSSETTKPDLHCKGYKATTSRKENSSANTTDTNPVRIGERHNNITADASGTLRIAENICIGLDEPDNVSPESDAAICALPRRRKMKLRSLADILEDENNSTSEHIKRRSALSSGVQVTSTEKDDDAPHRKRKITDEDGRVSPLGTAKRLKGPPIPDSEKRRRIPEVCDSESGGDGSAKLDENPQQIKHKRNKALEINRKMKQTHSGNRSNIGPVPPESLQKHAASVETSYDNMKHVPPTLRGEMEPYLNSLLSGKQMSGISGKSKSKRPEVEVDRSPRIPSRKRFIGDCSVQRKLALDLSLNSCEYAEINSSNQISWRQHKGLPDLNESFTEKSSASQWKQLIASDNRCSTSHKNLDMATSCSKQMAGDRRQFGESEPQAIQKIHNNVEHGGASDDIPMDIVELLAKNQRERTLENPRNHLVSSTANNSIRGSPSIYFDRQPGVINFPVSNARSGISIAGGETGLKGGFLSYPQVRNGRLDNRDMEEKQFHLFSSFKPCQTKKTQYSASNYLFSSEGGDLLWPPRRKNVSFHGPNMQPFPEQRYKGKTIIDTKGEGRRVSGVKEGRIGSLDAYSNDTIPAMQLLSLMDHAGGSNSYLDKTLTPCNHHPHLNVDNHSKDLPPLMNGARFPGQSSKKSYVEGNTKAFNLEGPDYGVIQPSRNDVGLGICSLNRNPADFSIPDAKNEYTITARDLKWRKKKSMRERVGGVNLEGAKRGRGRKMASERKY